MEKYTGIWLDHRQAIIVSIAGESESRHRITSGAETRRRILGEGKQYTRMGNAFLAPEHRQEERLKHQLDKYYEAICTYVQDASDILIFGPGEAKTELEKVMRDHESLAIKLRHVETADRLTENQVAAQVREFTAKMGAFKHPLNHPYST